ncbi:hypothetical protein [Azospirillum oryzae]|uniref:hypothetical protein n=1 Tax=Azospirillum oryzae TaxID=286727 RepID=UPI003D772782
MSADLTLSTLRKLPQVQRLIDDERSAALVAAHGRTPVLQALRAELDALRTALRSGAAEDDATNPGSPHRRRGRPAGAGGRAGAAPRRQRHRNRPAHQSGPRPAGAGGDGRRHRRSGGLYEP